LIDFSKSIIVFGENEFPVQFIGSESSSSNTWLWGCYKMNLEEKLVKEFSQLSEDKKKEVIDFVEFLKMKERNEKIELMDLIIDENEEALKELVKYY